MSTSSGRRVVRVRGLPRNGDLSPETAVRKVLNKRCPKETEYQVSIVPACDKKDKSVALIDFSAGLPEFLSSLKENPFDSWEETMDDGEDISFDIHFNGFTQLYETGAQEDIRADIIAICGIDGHAYISWQGRGNTRRMWLRHFLTKDLPSCRMMVYGYNAKLSTRGLATTEHYSLAFLEDIKRIRKEETHRRPLIFVAHSFGGIILARSLIRVMRNDEHDHPALASLLNSTYGILFFAVPHRGLDIEDMSQILKEDNNNPRIGLLQQISVDSEQLRVQLSDFRNILGDRKVVSFYETEQTRRLQRNEAGEWKRTGEYMTSLQCDSAVLQLPRQTETPIPLDGDHSAIVKYNSKDDTGYGQAITYLQDFVLKAPMVIQQRFLPKVQDYKLPFILPRDPICAPFVGRSHEMTQINETLLFDSGRRIAVVYGLGGIGKTQIAIEYAKSQQTKYTAVLWIEGRDEASLQQSFVEVSKRLSHKYPASPIFKTAAESKDLADAKNAVLRWLEDAANSNWLLIIDGIDTPRIPHVVDGSYNVQDYIPETLSHGHVLITTRSAQLGIGRQIQVQKLNDDRECFEILKYTSRRPNIEHEPQSLKLIQRLDGLPLALSSAGAYLSQTGTPVTTYLKEYEDQWRELQEVGCLLQEHEGYTLQTIWELSREQVEKREPKACRLLELWGFFSNQDVWFGLLESAVVDHFELSHVTSGREAVPEWFEAITKSSIQFKKCITVLCNYGLVEAQRGEELLGYGMHNCVHDWVREVLNDTPQEVGAQGNGDERSFLALRCISLTIPSNNEAHYWMMQRRLLGHANVWMKWVKKKQKQREGYVPDDGHCRYLHYLGGLFADQSRLSTAETIFTWALAGLVRKLGERHILTLATTNDFGLLCYRQNQFVKAETLLKQALTGREKLLGPKNMAALSTSNNLGLLYRDQGRYSEAEAKFLHVSEGFGENLGNDDIATLSVVSNLGSLYLIQDKFTKAESMISRALNGFERRLGQEHLTTLDTVNNLGTLYWKQGRLAEAEAMYKRGLEGREKASGPEHLSTLQIVGNLGNVYHNQSQYTELDESTKADKLREAEAMYTRALEGYQKVAGQEHTLTLQVANNLGTLYRSQLRLEEAEKFYMKALQGREKTLGGTHLSTLETVANLGNLYSDSQGKVEEAEAMYTRALEGLQVTVGQDHTSTLKVLHSLGGYYLIHGRLSEAETMLVRARDGRVRLLGWEHIDTLNVIDNLGYVYVMQNRLAEAEEMWVQALKGLKKVLGADHAACVEVANNLRVLEANMKNKGVVSRVSRTGVP